jgi:hypothetical protein
VIGLLVAGLFVVGIVLKALLAMEIGRETHRVLHLPEDELRAELAKDGETIEAARARIKEVFERQQVLAVIRRLQDRLLSLRA